MFIPKADRLVVSKIYKDQYDVTWEGDIVCSFHTLGNAKSFAKKVTKAMVHLQYCDSLDGSGFAEAVGTFIANAQNPGYGFNPVLPG